MMKNPTREEVERVKKKNADSLECSTLVDFLCFAYLHLLEENDRMKKDDGCPYEYDDEKCMAHQRRQAVVVEAAKRAYQEHSCDCDCPICEFFDLEKVDDEEASARLEAGDD